jgi:hypothetical protein
VVSYNIFVNGKVVATYDKTLVNNVKAVDQVAYMHTDALGNIVNDAVVVGIIEGFINLSAVSCLGG